MMNPHVDKTAGLVQDMRNHTLRLLKRRLVMKRWTLVLLIVCLTLTLAACQGKDYSADIEDLQERVDSLEAQLEGLEGIPGPPGEPGPVGPATPPTEMFADPIEVGQGGTFDLYGSGFNPSETVSIQFQYYKAGGLATYETSVETTSVGTFTVPVMVPEGTYTPYTYAVKAFVGGELEATTPVYVRSF